MRILLALACFGCEAAAPDPTLFLAGAGAQQIALDSEWIYWIDGNQAVRRMPKSGGGVVGLASGAAPVDGCLGQLALDGEFVYWKDCAERSVWRVPAIGGDVERVVEGPIAQFTVENGVLVWSDYYHLYRLDGGEVTRSLNDYIHWFVARGGDLYWWGHDRTFLDHWNYPYNLYLVPAEGGMRPLLDEDWEHYDLEFAVGNGLLWNAGDILERAALDGSQRRVVGTGERARRMRAIGSAFYWIGTDGIRCLGSDERARTVVARDCPGDFVLDGDTLYFTCEGNLHRVIASACP